MNLLSSTHLFFLLAIYSPQSLLPCVQCSKLCPHKCICYEHADLVDCRDRGFEHVPRGLPHSTWLLELGRNNLSVIGTQAFKGLGLSRLRQLYLHNNKLTVVQHGSLDMLPGLEVNRLLFFKRVNKEVPQSCCFVLFLIVDCCRFSL
uniref:LRRNT domain-containing protein n=1 Tax=Pundamilia nyererei TaxID=303518 RepID=A0A3B4GER3_9CICH